MGTAKSKNPLAAYFDDVADVAITADDESIVCIKGIALYHDVQVKITVGRKDNILEALKLGKKITSATPLYKGTISLMSPDGKNRVLISEVKKREKGEGAKLKDLYASTPFRSNSIDPDILSGELFDNPSQWFGNSPCARSSGRNRHYI